MVREQLNVRMWLYLKYKSSQYMEVGHCWLTNGSDLESVEPRRGLGVRPCYSYSKRHVAQEVERPSDTCTVAYSSVRLWVRSTHDNQTAMLSRLENASNAPPTNHWNPVGRGVSSIHWKRLECERAFRRFVIVPTSTYVSKKQTSVVNSKHPGLLLLDTSWVMLLWLDNSSNTARILKLDTTWTWL